MARKNIEDDEDVLDEPKRKKSKSKKTKNGKAKVELRQETRHGIWGVLFFVLALIIVLSFFGGAGVAGEFMQKVFNSFFGIGYYILPIILFLVGVSFLRQGPPQVAMLHTLSGAGVILGTLGIISIAQNGKELFANITLGGYLGSIFAWPFIKLFGIYVIDYTF